jgi:hypothetical protein
MEMEHMVRLPPQRIAWLVLLLSFFLCCALTVGVPLGAASYINRSSFPALITVKLQAGRTNVFAPPVTEADARVVGQEGRVVEEGTTVIVDGDIPSQALLTILENDSITSTLVSMQLYSGARVRVERARIPRFGIASSAAEITISLLTGRVQIQCQNRGSHGLKMIVQSDEMSAVLDSGSYSFEISDNDTSLFVRSGMASVTSSAKTETFNIEANQRTIVSKGKEMVLGLYAPPRDLVRNGRFQSPLERDWETSADLYVANDVTGTVSIIGTGANSALLLSRPGSGLNWGRTGVKQMINENVSGRSSLQLRINFTILYQELKVCGSQGSECPLMVKINYRNTSGDTAEWTQGFYADGTPRMPDLPDFIVQSAEQRTKHIATRLGVDEPYESPNLITALKDVEYVNYIQLYAEGHALQTQINSVELLVLD